MTNLFAKYLTEPSPLILDGGLATAFEALGHDLNDSLWSFRTICDHPEVALAVHLEYLEAGADIIIAGTYQGSFPGLLAAGTPPDDMAGKLLEPLRIAQEAKKCFWEGKSAGRREPLVAASIGPYGAYLADGSEYSGAYGVSDTVLRTFHAARFRLYADADLIACETLPSLAEAEILAALAAELPVPCTWLSFSCRDGGHISDGTSFAACARLAERSPGIVALGVNCTAPQHVADLLRAARTAGLTKPLVVYPNSGERFDAGNKTWSGERTIADFATQALEWHALGAQVIGGCCRTGPDHVRAVRATLRG